MSATETVPQVPRARRVSRLPAGLRMYWAALRLLLVFTVICGVAYPLLITGIAQGLFSGQANGSMVTANGQTVGSSLIGQAWTDPQGNPLPQWFQPRPSAATTNASNPNDPGYNALNSGASNLGPSNPTLLQSIAQRRAQVAAFNGVAPSAVPPDALTASASGLDPDISPAYAYLQVDRVAKARNLPPSAVRALVDAHVQGRDIGFLGEQRVDVLDLNVALAQLKP